MNQVTDENSVKVVQRFPFDVVAVPQNNASKIFDTATDTARKPVNIKIRVRNNEEMSGGYGIISVPKLSTSGPKKVRLVSSDQTIISFDLFMENENAKKVSKRPHYKFFQLFKTSGCFNNETDEDVYPYEPSSSNETYRTKSASIVTDLRDDKIFEDKFALKKNLPATMTNNIPLRTPTFLGKCKPGGCLDPPFSEENYIYKPKSKMLALNKKAIEKQGVVNENQKNDITDKIVDTLEIILTPKLSKISIKEAYSHSLITYPAALSSSEIRVQERNQRKKSKIRTSIENKARISINEFSDTYFMPPKKRQSKIIEKIDTGFRGIQITTSDNFDTKTENLSLKELRLSPTPINELLILTSEAKTLNENDKTQKSEINYLFSFSEKNVTDAASLLLYKDAITNEVTPTQDCQTSKNISHSNEILSEHIHSKQHESTDSQEKMGYYKLPPSIKTETKNKVSKIKNNSNEIINELNLMNRIPDESTKSQESQNIQNPELRSIFLNNDENQANRVTQDYQVSESSVANETIDNSKLIHEIPGEPLDSSSLASQRQRKIQSLVGNKDLGSDFVNTDENIRKFERLSDPTTYENKIKPVTNVYLVHSNKSISNETLNKSKLTHYTIPDEPVDNHSLASQTQHELQQSLENEVLVSNLANTNGNIINFEHDITTDENKNKLAFQDFQFYRNKRFSNETLNKTQSSQGLPDEPLDTYSLGSQRQYKLQQPLENEVLVPNLANTNKNIINFERDITDDENKNKFAIKDIQVYRNKSFSNEALKKSQASQRIPDEPLDTYSLASQRQYKLQQPLENEVLVSNLANTINLERDLTTDVNKNKLPIQDFQVYSNESFSNEILKKLQPSQGIPNKSLDVASLSQCKLQSSVESQYSISDLSSTKESMLKVENDQSNVDNLQQKDFPGIANLYDKVQHTQPEESQYSNLIDNSQSREIINHQPNLQLKKPLQNEISAVVEIKKDTCDTNDRDISMLTVDNADENQLAHHKSIRLISEDFISSIITTEPKLGEKRRSSIPVDSNTKSGNLDSNEEITMLTLQEKLSSILQMQGKHTIKNSSIYDSHNLLDAGKLASSIDYLDVNNSDNDVEALNNIVSNKIQSLKNMFTGDHRDSSTTGIKSIDREAIETERQSQCDNINFSSEVSDSKKQNIKISINKNIGDTEIHSRDIPIYQSPLILNTSKECITHLEANDNNHQLIKKYDVQNKNSSIHIDLGFYSFENDKNETTIKSYDTAKTLEMDPKKKTTLIKSMIRKNGSEIRIPVNSEIDLALEIKKSLPEGSTSRRYIDVTKKESANNTSNKDILLQETLESVYEHLVPVENIIRNLKQEADSLSQQQLLFREILSNMKRKSQTFIKTSNKCTCNKYLL